MILIENDYLEKVCKINPEAKIEDVVYDGVKFKCIKNFLHNPDEYVELIQKFPATRDHTYSLVLDKIFHLGRLDLSHCIFKSLLENGNLLEFLVTYTVVIC